MYTAVACIIPLLHTCIFYPISKCNVCQSYCATNICMIVTGWL